MTENKTNTKIAFRTTMKFKDMLDSDRNLLGITQRQYIEYLVKKENKLLKDDKYLLDLIKSKPLQ